MKAFAIRQKSTGAFLPAGRSRGFTHDEPTPGAVPRLFLKLTSAKSALRCWLQGEWKEETSGGYSYLGEEDVDVYPVAPKEPPEHRKPDDMEIVTVKLTVVE